MANKPKKSDIAQEEKVHVDFVGDAALFIRRVASHTGRSNNEVGNLLVGLMLKMEETITITLQPEAEITAKNGNKPIRFKQIKEIRIQI